jgi:hypothetical protein
MSHLRVDRYPSEIDWTLSEYFLLSEKFGVGVEDEYRAKKVHGETRIPNGIYPITFEHSPKFSDSYFMDVDGNLSRTKTERFNQPHLLLTVLGVQGFSRILWHWGNSDEDTEGCYVVGSYFGKINTKKGVKEGVLESRPNYVKLYPKIYQLWKQNIAAGIQTTVEYRDRIAA